MAHYPQPHRTTRAPRIRANGEAVRLAMEGKVISGALRKISTTGGLASVKQKALPGTLAEITVVVGSGPINGLAELLYTREPQDQAFRFIALSEEDHERLALLIRMALAGLASRAPVMGRR